MAGWHHRLSGREFEQTPGGSEGQETLVCCSPWGRRESDTTEQLKTGRLAQDPHPDIHPHAARVSPRSPLPPFQSPPPAAPRMTRRPQREEQRS